LKTLKPKSLFEFSNNLGFSFFSFSILLITLFILSLLISAIVLNPNARAFFPDSDVSSINSGI